jgi:hypothetical protein
LYCSAEKSTGGDGVLPEASGAPEPFTGGITSGNESNEVETSTVLFKQRKAAPNANGTLTEGAGKAAAVGTGTAVGGGQPRAPRGAKNETRAAASSKVATNYSNYKRPSKVDENSDCKKSSEQAKWRSVSKEELNAALEKEVQEEKDNKSSPILVRWKGTIVMVVGRTDKGRFTVRTQDGKEQNCLAKSLEVPDNESA